jgi:molecular chaperone GrpE
MLSKARSWTTVTAVDNETPKFNITDRRGVPKEEPRDEPDAEQVEKDVDEAAKLAEERMDQLLRLKADFENYRKRVIREQTELVERASLRMVEKLFPILDDLDRALDAAEGNEAIVRGIEIVKKQLHQVLAEEGLERVEAEGAFDPNHHEAVSSIPGDVDEPTVLEVVRPGYKLKGKTVRPALVHVTVPEGGEQ